MSQYQQKKLNYKELPGISEKTLMNHEKLYAGYVAKTKAIGESIERADKSDANATYSQIRELKLEESFSRNGVILHEAYFESLGGNGAPEGKIIEQIKKDFGSFEKWLEDFKACGLASRGWAILAYDFNDNKLHNYTCEFHSHGGIWGAAPILVLDVYEHAYFIDYGADRKSYIEAFLKNIDWNAVSKKFEKMLNSVKSRTMVSK